MDQMVTRDALTALVDLSIRRLTLAELREMRTNWQTQPAYVQIAQRRLVLERIALRLRVWRET